MRKLLGTAVLFQYNYRMLHWNVKSTDFDSVHALMDEYVEKFHEFIDLFGEMCIMLGEKPMALYELDSVLPDPGGLFKALDNTTLYSPKEVFERSGEMLKTFQDVVRETLADDSLPRGIQSELEVVDFWITKELNYKNKHRLA